MPEPADLATAIATEVAKQIPVKDAYEDAIQPGARQVGGVIEDIAKTIRLVLAPLQITGALQDRFRDFLDTSIRRIPEENRLPPPPQILGPVLEGIRYEPEGTPVSEMFSQLLSSSLDRERVQNAHPAFPLLIKQISSDEAILLHAMWNFLERGKYIRQQIKAHYNADTNMFYHWDVEIDEIPKDSLVFSENVTFYTQHLYSLGLSAFYDSANAEYIYEDGKQVATRSFKELRLTDLGLKFMSAVTPTRSEE